VFRKFALVSGLFFVVALSFIALFTPNEIDKGFWLAMILNAYSVITHIDAFDKC